LSSLLIRKEIYESDRYGAIEGLNQTGEVARILVLSVYYSIDLSLLHSISLSLSLSLSLSVAGALARLLVQQVKIRLSQ
jgi:hypothetical protein